MITILTDQDRERFDQIEQEYDRKIAEITALIEELAPENDLDGLTDEEILGKRPKAPTPIDYTKDGLPVYNKDELKAWEKENDRISAEMNRIFDEWYASGSQEWKDAREEKLRLMLEKSEALNNYQREIALREFAKLGNDREKIIESARDQISRLIKNRYEDIQKIVETRMDEEGHEISGVSARYLRVDGRKFYLDSSVMVKDCESLLELHFDALKDDPEATKLISDMIFTIVTESPLTSSDKGQLGKTLTLYKARKPRSKKQLPSYDIKRDDFFPFATTPMKDVIYDLLSDRGDVNQTAKKINSVGKRKKAQIAKKEEGKEDANRVIQVKTENSQTIVEILSSAYENMNSRTAKKILLFIESELYKQTYYKGKMNDDVVIFPLQEMVDKELYNSLQNARRAFDNASNVLTAIRVSATLKSGKKESSTKDGKGRAVLFPTMGVEKGQCYVRLNPDINWSPYMKDFFLMPDSWWALPGNASDLEYKIFRAIRLNKDKIKSNGQITLNMKLSSVATWLNLPLNTKNPKRNVKDPIETAVKQISDSLDPKNFSIVMKTDLNAPLTQYLNGYLEITVGGAYTQNLLDLNETQERRIEQAVKRKNRIINEASIRKLTEQMKKESESDQKSAE